MRHYDGRRSKAATPRLDRYTLMSVCFLVSGLGPCVLGVANCLSPAKAAALFAGRGSQLMDVASVDHSPGHFSSEVGWPWTQFWMRLQGGDCFVAGAFRVALAIFTFYPVRASSPFSNEATVDAVFLLRRTAGVVVILHAGFLLALLVGALEWGTLWKKFAGGLPTAGLPATVMYFGLVQLFCIAGMVAGLTVPKPSTQSTTDSTKVKVA